MESTPKLLREKGFHNEWARTILPEGIKVRESFEACTAVENRFALKEMGDISGKKILDVGCGAGETSIYFAMQGAKVWACDVSEEFLKLALRLASQYQVCLHTVQIDAGRLPFRDGSFDFVFGNGILHHVELLSATRELARVLKKGGKALFVEPLPYNPVINVYRFMARAVRSEDERPLSFAKLRAIRSFFSSYHHREFWFATLLIFLYFFFIKGWHPGRVRYWKKVIEDADSFEKLFVFLQRIDDFVLKYFPFVRPLCWNTVLVFKK